MSQKKLASALAYPMCVLGAAVILVVFLLSVTVPTFQRMFDQLGIPLPLATRLLVRVGTLANAPVTWILIASVALITLAVLVTTKRTPTLARHIDGLSLDLPVIGGLQRKRLGARFCRTLERALLKSGVNLHDGLFIMPPVCDNARFSYHDRASAGYHSPRQGSRRAYRRVYSIFFDALGNQLIRVGEETGALDGEC